MSSDIEKEQPKSIMSTHAAAVAAPVVSAGFSTLPEEMLVEVVSYLESADWASIRHVSRRLRRLAQEKLLDNIVIRYEGLSRRKVIMTNIEMLEIAANAKLLRIVLPGDQFPQTLPLLKELLNHLQHSKLKRLIMRQTEMDAETWSAMDKMLNTTPANTVCKNLDMIDLPRLTEAESLRRWRIAKDKALAENPLQPKRLEFDNVDIASCSVTVSFVTEGVGKDRTIRVKATGRVDRYDSMEHNINSCIGTDLVTFRKFIQTMGFQNTFDSVELYNSRLAAYPGVLKEICPNLNDKTTGIRWLSLSGMVLNIPEMTSHWNALDIPYLAVLRLTKCGGLGHFLRMILKSKVNAGLHTFECVNPQPGYGLHMFEFSNEQHSHLNDKSALETFLHGMPGLRTIKLIAEQKWSIELKNALQNSANLQDLTLRFGLKNITPGMISIIRQHCPSLKSISFPLSAVGSAIDYGEPKGWHNKEVQKRAVELVRMRSLENVGIIISPLKGKDHGTMETQGQIRRVSDCVHQVLKDEDASGSASGLNVQRISIEIAQGHKGTDEEFQVEKLHFDY